MSLAHALEDKKIITNNGYDIYFHNEKEYKKNLEKQDNKTVKIYPLLKSDKVAEAPNYYYYNYYYNSDTYKNKVLVKEHKNDGYRLY